MSAKVTKVSMSDTGSSQSLDNDPTGLRTLACAIMIAGMNGLLFGFSTFGLQFPPTAASAEGLSFNLVAIIIGWIGFARGRRQHVLHKLAAVTTLTIIHYYLISNLAAVIVDLR